VYAGQNGANDYQGDSMAAKLSPRVGIAVSFTPTTVVRGGYGIYWAPWNYQPVTGINSGQIGYVRQTFTSQGQFVPSTTLDNPFPNGALQPVGNTLGPLTGVGGQVEFVDQAKGSPWIQQYSVDVEQQLGDSLSIGAEYIGATGRSLGLGGSNDAVLNINQLDPGYLSLGNALLDQVPNPFFGLPAGQGFAVTSPTVQRRQLLRPFPQFGDILMRQSTLGSSQYHAAVLTAEKRMTNGWGGRISYTFSRHWDNQFGETNFLQSNTPEALNAYDVAAEYALSIIDVPHKLMISPIVELPFGEGKKWARSGVASLMLGGWSVSTVIGLESGFLIPVASLTNNTNRFTRMQRPNATGADPNTSGTPRGSLGRSRGGRLVHRRSADPWRTGPLRRVFRDETQDPHGGDRGDHVSAGRGVDDAGRPQPDRRPRRLPSRHALHHFGPGSALHCRLPAHPAGEWRDATAPTRAESEFERIRGAVCLISQVGVLGLHRATRRSAPPGRRPGVCAPLS
jgi:trimeric autotransporter adhesin